MTGAPRKRWAVLALTNFFELKPSVGLPHAQPVQHRHGLRECRAVTGTKNATDAEAGLPKLVGQLDLCSAVSVDLGNSVDK